MSGARSGQPPRRGEGKAPLADRLRSAVLKPAEPSASGGPASDDEPLTVADLEAASRSADDKERLIGLLAAPLAAAIGLLVIGALISHDPAAVSKSGQPNAAHVSVGLYEGLGAVLVGLSLAMLAAALLRKRLYLGIATALYGLAIFNLHYWGFGIPFVLAGAWYLVRAYRIQRNLREALADELPPPPARGGPSRVSRPQPRKRYSPPAPTRNR